MSEAIYDMTAFMKLTDHIFHAILYSSDDNLKPAKNWLNRILCRQLPKSVGALKCEDVSILTICIVTSLVIYYKSANVILIFVNVCLEFDDLRHGKERNNRMVPAVLRKS